MSLLDDVEAWCAALPRRRPLHLLNVRPTAEQLAAHPASLHTQAYFAGARHAAGERPQPFPRPLTADEAECWSDGYGEHLDTAPEVRCDTPATSPRPVLLGILGSSLEPWYEHDRGRAGGPAREVS